MLLLSTMMETIHIDAQYGVITIYAAHFITGNLKALDDAHHYFPYKKQQYSQRIRIVNILIIKYLTFFV